MSILSSLYHGEVHNKPNDVHNTPEKSTGHTDGSAVLPAHAQQRMQALRDGNLRPPLYYTQQEQTPCANGRVGISAHGGQQAGKQGRIPPGIMQKVSVWSPLRKEVINPTSAEMTSIGFCP